MHDIKIRKQERGYRLTFNKHLLKFSQLEEEEGGNKMLERFCQDERIKRFKFCLEYGKEKNNKHWQGYIEFFCLVDIKAFKKRHDLSFVEKAKEDRETNEKYVVKQGRKVFFFNREKQKATLPKRNTLSFNIDKSLINLNQKLKLGRYEKFDDIEKDFELLYIKHPDLCKKLWNNYHPVNSLDVKAARTIWIYGISGIGKSTWTDKFLKKQNFLNEEIVVKKASNEVRPILWFTLEDEEKKVLWVEEIRTNFPHYNDIIQIIDRKSYLETKGSQIRNNFELIIFNSLFSPLEVYRSLPQEHQTEVLRRLYRGNNSVVLEIVDGDRRYNKVVDQTNSLPEILLNKLSKQMLKKTKGLKVWNF